MGGELRVFRAEGKEPAQRERMRAEAGQGGVRGRAGACAEGGSLLRDHRWPGGGQGEAGSRSQAAAPWGHLSCPFRLVVAFWGQCQACFLC